MKRHKEQHNAPSNGEPDVFVLPPHLLEKMGIQLSNIKCPTDSPADHSIASQSNIKKNEEEIPSSVENSSILETANLMKQSVLMSPTFVTALTTETTIEIVNKISNINPTTEESTRESSDLYQVNNLINADIDSSYINPTVYTGVKSEDFVKYEPIKEYEVGNDGENLILSNISYETNNTNIDHISHKVSPVDDHADEAYSSDGSNSYSGTCTETSNNYLESSLEQQKPSNKIQILSEQIINNSDLHTIKKSRLNESNSCFIIPVNAIVTGKPTKDRHNKHSDTTIEDKLFNTPEIKIEINHDKHSKTTNQDKLCNAPEIKTEINHDIGHDTKSRLNECNSCFIIPVNAIVTGKSTKDRHNNHSNTTIQDKLSNTPKIKMERNHDKHSETTIRDKLCNTPEIKMESNHDIGHDTSMNIEMIKNRGFVVENSSISTNPSLLIDVIPKEFKNETNIPKEFKNETRISEEFKNETVTDDVGCEIPLNVEKHAHFNNNDNMIKKNCDIAEDQQNIQEDAEDLKLRTISDNFELNVSNNENSTSKSKLCIQGVEKPGGIQENKGNIVHKTYQRTQLRKQIPELTHVDFNHIEDLNVLPDNALDDINLEGYKNNDKFCICSDFGQLATYDNDVDYEHLHFHGHISVGCNLETIFSMYEDASAIYEFKGTEDIEVIDTIAETTKHEICWLSLFCKDSDEALEIPILESEDVGESNANPGQLRRSNRKRNSIASGHITDIVEPKPKKTVKCGACDLIIPEVEWNKHNDLEHNLIAWKNDKYIDLKNKGLLKKLGLKLKKLGVLRCTFCNTDKKYLSKYIQHVKTCIKRKIENASIAIKIETSNKDIEKDTAAKCTQPTRRSSRNLNLGINVSETAIDKSSVEKKVQKSTSNDMKTKTLTTGKKIPTSLDKKDCDISESTKNKSSILSPKPAIKSEDKMSPKSNKKAKNNALDSKPVISVNVEQPVKCPQTLDVPSKSTGGKVTPKTTKRSIDVISKTQVTAKTEDKKTRMLTRQSTDNSLNVIEVKNTSESLDKKDCDISESTKNKSSILSPKSAIKSEDEMSPKSIKKTKNNALDSKPLISVNVEQPIKCPETLDVSSKTTGVKVTPKTTQRSIDVVSKTQVAAKTEDKKNRMLTRQSTDDSLHVIEVKNTRREYKNKKKLNSTISSKSSEIEDTLKAESLKLKDTQNCGVKDTSQSSRLSADVATKSTHTINSSKPEVKNELENKNNVTSKSTGRSKNIEVMNNTNMTKNSSQCAKQSVAVLEKPPQKSKSDEPANPKPPKELDISSKRMLKEIDIFSPSSKKAKNIYSPTKSTNEIKDDPTSSSISNDKTIPISSTSSVSPKKSKNIEAKVHKGKSDAESLKSNKKSVDSEQECTKVDASLTTAVVKSPAKEDVISVNAKEVSNITKDCKRDDKPKENHQELTPMAKKVNTSKLETKSQDASSSKRLSNQNRRTKQQVISALTTKAVNSRTIPSKLSVNVATKTPAQLAKTASSDNEASTGNSQEITASTSSSSNNDINAAHASSNNNTNAPSEDANNARPTDKIFIVTIKQEVLPKCGVCKKEVDESQWLEHIAKEHDYLAWWDYETPLDLQDDDAVRAHLSAIVKANGGLKCSKCNLVRKYVKSYLIHIANCNGVVEEQSQMDVSTTSADMDTSQDDASLRSSSRGAGNSQRPQRSAVRRKRLDVSSASVDSVDDDLDHVPLRSLKRGAPNVQRSVVCGVCNETVLENKWIDHIRMEHKYLAWKSGEPPLNVNSEAEVKVFLQNISKYNGGLICSKCGAIRSYVKKWMDHVAMCKGDACNESLENTLDESEANETLNLIEVEILPEIVKCAKCSKEMPGKAWLDHIEMEHNYLSWIEGQSPLDESNPAAVSTHLHSIVKVRGLLYCAKCGVTRKYPKAYLSHISACEISGFKRDEYYVEVSADAKPDEFECAVCHEKGNRKNWRKHAMDKHYNVAWMAGEIPINLKNPYAVEKYIKEYRSKHNLVCKVCGASRVSCYGFYAHILTCGKAEKDLEHLMNMCDICNNKYLCIYRNQHMAMHREQVLKKEKKERNAMNAEEERIVPKASIDDGEPSGKRRAAEKAKKVMEQYTSNIQDVYIDGSHVCISCHNGFDNQTQLKEHVCQKTHDDNASDSDVSVKMEGQEESDDDMEDDVDSNISEENDDPLKRRRPPESAPLKITLPFKVKDFNLYLARSFEHFRQLHYTSECLFNNWRCNEFEILQEEEASKYLPPLTESCKLRIEDEWETLKRFEAQKNKDITLFTGATVRCMQWVPQNIDCEKQDLFLSIACFRDSDCPRYGIDELHKNPGMLQIWRIGRFTTVPTFEMGIAHDYGTIWAMDWCPSGARDIVTSEQRGLARLGLLAIACSNGSAYIISVPQFNTEPEDEPKICKLKPVAELRLSIKPKQSPFRKEYQATSISWSPQKEHEVVMVGYSDGTTALYNLNTASPLLKSIEMGVHIFYPFHDAVTENSAITGVSLSASGDMRRIVGGVASSSVTGATMSGWPVAGPVVRSHLTTSGIVYTPSWPAALLCSDDALTMKSTNEMEWWSGGRRLGGACAASGCARCGRLCLAAPPYVRVLRAHPCYPEIKKQIVATLRMVPIAQKRKIKIVNDDLGMIVEPLTYEDAIKKYGLEFKTATKKENLTTKCNDNAEQCPERFPLSEMSAAAFCPSAEHHNRLAIASHAGFVFIIST